MKIKRFEKMREQEKNQEDPAKWVKHFSSSLALHQFLITIVNQTGTWNDAIRLPAIVLCVSLAKLFFYFKTHTTPFVFLVVAASATVEALSVGCTGWCANINIIFWLSILVQHFPTSKKKAMREKLFKCSTLSICFMIGTVEMFKEKKIHSSIVCVFLSIFFFKMWTKKSSAAATTNTVLKSKWQLQSQFWEKKQQKKRCAHAPRYLAHS